MNKRTLITAGLTGLIAGGVMAQADDRVRDFAGSVVVRDLPETRVAYVEQRGNFKGNGEIYDVLLNRILEWAVPNKLWDFPDQTKIINIYPDDPSVPEEEQRLWLGITVGKDVTPPEGMHLQILPAGQYAAGHFSVTAEQFAEAWGYMYGKWMAGSGYHPGEGLAFEIQHNDSSEHPEQKHIIDICIPVKANSANKD